jgi:sugar fermentation stimulation protein A
MAEFQLYDNFLEAEFLERSNRFVMKLMLQNKIVEAYVPNTGRMTEFLFPGRKFYVSEQNMPKYNYKVIGTEYQGNYVFLDTIKVNRIFQEILLQQILPEFRDHQNLRREVSFSNSRFDFSLSGKDGKKKIIEIKSCTLCHDGTAMFPDAPTERGQRHLSHLNRLTDKEFETWMIYLITNYSARNFQPNYHIDYNYGKIFLQSKNVKFKALKVDFSDPVTVVAESIIELPILYDRVSQNCQNSGTYLLILKNNRKFTKEIGALGERTFKPGFYVYVGSALRNLEQRIKRHRSSRKKIHWHIDRIIPKTMQIEKVHLIRSQQKLEHNIASKLEKISDSAIAGFGASDDNLDSHLFYFNRDPGKKEEFNRLILNSRSK